MVPFSNVLLARLSAAMMLMMGMTWSRAATLWLVLYWIALATATHLPQVPTLPLQHGDKAAHWVAYAGLAWALCWASATRRKLTWARLFAVWLVAVAYGAVDELTQIPVPGRYGDWRDWIADALGALAGCLLYVAAHGLWAAIASALRRRGAAQSEP